MLKALRYAESRYRKNLTFMARISPRLVQFVRVAVRIRAAQNFAFFPNMDNNMTFGEVA